MGLSGLGPLGELPGGALGARPRGTRGGLGGLRGKSPGRGTRGQVSRSEASGAIITRWARDALGSFREACGALGASGDTWRIRGHPE